MPPQLRIAESDAVSNGDRYNLVCHSEAGNLNISQVAKLLVRRRRRHLAVHQQGSCERSCTRDGYGKAGPFSVNRLKIDLLFP